MFGNGVAIGIKALTRPVQTIRLVQYRVLPAFFAAEAGTAVPTVVSCLFVATATRTAVSAL